MIIFLPFSCQREKKLGSFRYLFDFIIINAILGIIFIALCLLLSLANNQINEQIQQGLFPYFILFMTEDLFKIKEDQSQFLFLPLEIKNKYQPFIFAILLWIFIGFYPDYIISILLGILGLQIFKIDNIVSEEFIENLENNQKLSFIKFSTSFVSKKDIQTADFGSKKEGLIINEQFGNQAFINIGSINEQKTNNSPLYQIKINEEQQTQIN